MGGTKYEVSDSLLDQYPNSMLRRLTSEEWNHHKDKGLEEEEGGESNNEIFIERNGIRFQYVLDYMRDNNVSLPLAIPRAQFISDLEYFMIDYDDSNINLSVADPRDLFYSLSQYRDFFTSKKEEIDKRFREVAIEKVACELASGYFERLGRPYRVWSSDRSSNLHYSKASDEPSVTSCFAATGLQLPEIKAPRDISIQDVKLLMKEQYGLDVDRAVKQIKKNNNGGEVIVYSERDVSVKLSKREE